MLCNESTEDQNYFRFDAVYNEMVSFRTNAHENNNNIPMDWTENVMKVASIVLNDFSKRRK